MPADASLDAGSRMETMAACVRAGRHDEALALAKAAIDDGVDHPLPLRIAAAALAQVGRFDEALILHERCVRLAPGDPAVRAPAWPSACSPPRNRRRPWKPGTAPSSRRLPT
jgi:Flp pilus assembly protein TadD